MAESTVFDSVFKTLLHRRPSLMIPFINEAFGRSYPADSEIVRFSDEHESLRGTVIDDSVFRLHNKIYHVECQSTADANMVIRMVEYDFAIALEQALANGAPYEMEFPSSCVLFLRHTSHTPDVLTIKVNLPSGESFAYETKVVKAQSFTSDELFQKRLLILLPYYLMRYERELGRIASSNALTESLIAECVDLRARLAQAVAAENDRLLYEELIELIIRVSDHLLDAHKALQGKVRAAMGGEVLELLHQRAERLEREAMEQGLKLGREQGLEQGRELGLVQGLEQGREMGRELGLEQGIGDLAAKLAELGVDQDLLRQAADAVRGKAASE